MKKYAVLINGISAPIKDDYFLIEFLEKLGYEVMRIEPMRQETIEGINTEPDLVIGWSMGGLMAPVLALKYPRSKLILVATGIRIEPGEVLAKTVFEMVGKTWGTKLLGVSLKLPKNILIDSYEKLNPVPNLSLKDRYRKQMSLNIDLFKSLPEEYINGLVKYLREVDNTEILKKLVNKTLVVSGIKDKLMPVSGGKKMVELIKDSQLLVTEGGHYYVIGKSELPIIEEFLR